MLLTVYIKYMSYTIEIKQLLFQIHFVSDDGVVFVERFQVLVAGQVLPVGDGHSGPCTDGGHV